MVLKTYFPILSKLKFYLFLPLHKLIGIVECRNYRLNMFLSELLFPFDRHIVKFYTPSRERVILKTKFGDFCIRKVAVDFVFASPAFERFDLEAFLKLIKTSIDNKSKIIFLDIGGGFGKYTIAVGNYFKKSANQLKILSFEPELESFELLKENIRLNKVKNVSPFNIALSNTIKKKYFYFVKHMLMFTSYKDSSAERMLVKTAKLDSFIKFLPEKYQELYLKIDAEGHEVEILEGAKLLLKKFNKITLLIEDIVPDKKEKLLDYLEKNFIFLKKLTSYNSFWVKLVH